MTIQWIYVQIYSFYIFFNIALANPQILQMTISKVKLGKFPNNFFHKIVLELASKQLWNETTLDKLRKDLFANYDKYSRPEEHYNGIDVRIGMAITHLETNELESSITINCWIRLVITQTVLLLYFLYIYLHNVRALYLKVRFGRHWWY